ncbi:MAG: LON peptidase substrate-binding domain-containing protein [Verrucomicrobiia bacterium]
MRNAGMSIHGLTPPAMPSALPVMILPGVVFFPHSLLPLFIFEEKYRDMLEFALERDRYFCVALAKDEVDELTGHRLCHPVGSVGVVRACVRNPDGTSNLILQGVARVRFTQWFDDHTFPYASVEPIVGTKSNSLLCGTLREEILELLDSSWIKEKGVTPQMLECVRSLSDADAIADVLGGSLSITPDERVVLLEEASTHKRLTFLRDLLLKVVASQKDSDTAETL